MDSGVVGARMGGAVGGAGPQVSVNSFHGVVDSPADFTRSASSDLQLTALAPVAMTSPAVLAPAVVRVRLFEAPCKPAPAQSIRDTDAARTPRAAHGQRGLHVRGRPDMSRAARDGAAHWARMLSDVRAAWEKAADAFPADFHTQAEAAHGRIRAKLECLLRTLHLAAADGLLIPRLAEGGPSAGFLGWTGFVVAPGAGAAVRGAVQAAASRGWAFAWGGGAPGGVSASRAGAGGLAVGRCLGWRGVLRAEAAAAR
eukprot:CAMPEP_0113677454 /NCGR_PEP_ID=MMETSP0038_2-20120614/9281_1 /TAXON_ID=2898 /ORGANISM="Cryptomonas paramecium" /LENGTH=255 /DNA_ID=CAMNT_0000594743 /DNA_START=211 /DNA_END=978 /DNA_ORIENTATION=- /assembly_acc=CAM_ASM_000170